MASAQVVNPPQQDQPHNINNSQNCGPIVPDCIIITTIDDPDASINSITLLNSGTLISTGGNGINAQTTGPGFFVRVTNSGAITAAGGMLEGAGINVVTNGGSEQTGADGDDGTPTPIAGGNGSNGAGPGAAGTPGTQGLGADAENGGNASGGDAGDIDIENDAGITTTPGLFTHGINADTTGGRAIGGTGGTGGSGTGGNGADGASGISLGAGGNGAIGQLGEGGQGGDGGNGTGGASGAVTITNVALSPSTASVQTASMLWRMVVGASPLVVVASVWAAMAAPAPAVAAA